MQKGRAARALPETEVMGVCGGEGAGVGEG